MVTSVIALPDEDPTSVVPKTTVDPAPLVIWGNFDSWEAYLALVRKRSKSLLRTQRQRLRKLVEQFGEPEFVFDNPDIAAFNTCIEWKIQQYKGGHETLESAASVAMLRRLFEDRHLILSTLHRATADAREGHGGKNRQTGTAFGVAGALLPGQAPGSGRTSGRCERPWLQPQIQRGLVQLEGNLGTGLVPKARFKRVVGPSSARLGGDLGAAFQRSVALPREVCGLALAGLDGLDEVFAARLAVL